MVLLYDSLHEITFIHPIWCPWPDVSWWYEILSNDTHSESTVNPKQSTLMMFSVTMNESNKDNMLLGKSCTVVNTKSYVLLQLVFHRGWHSCKKAQFSTKRQGGKRSELEIQNWLRASKIQCLCIDKSNVIAKTTSSILYRDIHIS